MSLRNIASLAIALFVGLIAVLMVRGIMMSQRPAGPAASTAGMTPVVVAALPIERGATVGAPMLKVVDYPQNAVPAGAFTSVEQLAGKGAERTALRSMTANEPVLAAKLSGAGGRTNLSGTLTPGMRAISVSSSDVAGVGGFVLPGDRVDIFVTRTLGKGESETSVTQVMAENALVLGVDQTSDVEADKPQVAKAVTVEVTPAQAQSITLAQSVGQVSLALRQVADHDSLATKMISTADLGGFRRVSLPGPGKAPAKAAAAPAPKLFEVRVTRGVETSGYPLAAD